ncbi:CYTH and CHAD domain-containing protein [Phycicoccus sp. Soil748]|uniref:CYTH and CHAD domain-containing protein n=1 Tax=Phycicoccus sp. Soil748 TaxID=1736397 RepID=UPI0007033130|nr:CYTH and CHAD domain-containing protein [Phycicoccus sp. Soil748]KRE59011.1 hypothetical protein ASG70_17485 [Phycicoccus sp. Soil748]
MGTQATRQDEVERKYDVGPDLALPVLTVVDEVASMGQQEVLDLQAVYYDTAGLDLHRHGISLRRRTGGVDDGWHLKLPREGDRRTEVHLPLGRAVRTVPAKLLEPVRAIVRDRPLLAVATLTTHRLQQTALDDEGHVLATVCDDRVEGQSTLDPDRRLYWREVELELGDGQPDGLLARLEAPLLEGGASRSQSTSKVRRVLGEPGDLDGDKDCDGDGVRGRRQARRPRRGRKAKAATVFLTQAEHHVRDLYRHDRGVREGERGSVHQLRIAARRLRSTLDTFGPLMVPGSTDLLRAELRWVGQALAAARDAEVLRQGMDRLVADQPAELVLGPVSSRIDRDLAKARAAGVEAAGEAMSSERYYRLLDLLDDAVRSPRWSGSAGRRAGEVLPRLLAKDARAVRRAARRAREVHGPDRDLALHTVRKKAKRLRYAAESAQVVLGPGTAKLAKHAKQVQSALGDHHDSVVARAALRQWGIEAHLDGENAFTFGLLHGLEQARGQAAEESFDVALSRLGKKPVRRELRQ